MKELGGLEEESAALIAKWLEEKKSVADVQSLKEKLDAARSDVEMAQRKGDRPRRRTDHCVIPPLERKLKAIEDNKDARFVGRSGDGGAYRRRRKSRWTGIPVDKMLEGQRKSCRATQKPIWKAWWSARTRRCAPFPMRCAAPVPPQDPNRPIGSFLFLGPTGGGQDRTDQGPSGFRLDDDTAMVRIDRSEFMEKHAEALLIYAPPGYVGYEEGGVLTEAVRRRPIR